MAIAEEAASGATTPLYGRVAAFLRNLSGVRNPSVTAWQWRHVTFVVVIVARECADGGLVEEVCFVALLLYSRWCRPDLIGQLSQVGFGIVVHLIHDKAPNKFGAKVIAVNPTGNLMTHSEDSVTLDDDDAAHRQDADIASVGCQLLSMAMHQGLLRPEDLQHLPVGTAFTVPALIARREGAAAADLAERARDMCASSRALRGGFATFRGCMTGRRGVACAGSCSVAGTGCSPSGTCRHPTGPSAC